MSDRDDKDRSVKDCSKEAVFERLRRARATGEIVRDLSFNEEDRLMFVDDDDDRSGELEASPAKRRRRREKPRNVFDIKRMVEAAAESTVTDAAADLDAFEHLSVDDDDDRQACSKTPIDFYWLDLCEEESSASTNVLHLFGKIAIADRYESCVVRVVNVERKLILVPKRIDSIDHVEREFCSKVAGKVKIARMNRVTVKNCFYQDLAQVIECVEVFCIGSVPESMRFDTVDRVIGRGTSLAENFLLLRELKGPRWLRLENAVKVEETSTKRSWCKNELLVDSCAGGVRSMEKSDNIPELKVLSLSFGFVTNFRNHQLRELSAVDGTLTCFKLNEPCTEPWTMLGGPFDETFSVVASSTSVKIPFDFKAVCSTNSLPVISLTTERALLCYLLNKIHLIDPDVIIGHDIARSHLETFMGRITETKTPYWSKLGRLKRSLMPKLATATCGRLVIDVSLSARELISKNLRSFDLETLCDNLLHERCVAPLDASSFKSCFAASETLLLAVEQLRKQSVACLNIAAKLNILPLAYQTTSLCGNLLSRTLLGGRAERNEFLLLHAFNRATFLLPEPFSGALLKVPLVEKKVDGEDDDDGDEQEAFGTKTKKEAKHFVGGLVLEPKIGFYDSYVLLLDFNSLYPSIIQEYNLCFSTSRESSSKGVLPTEIEKLVKSRKEVRKLMQSSLNNPDLYAQYMIRQTALKLTANSVYGCLGYTRSRFYSRNLAAQITALGRETLEKTKSIVESLNIEVIYGDTDSLMINTCLNDIEQVRQLGLKLKAEINRHYQRLEIDVDGVFKCLLLMKKKKYAGLLVENVDELTGNLVTSRHVKGLDLVRRDWCPLAKECGSAVLDHILSGKSLDEVIGSICSVLSELHSLVDSVPFEKFLIDKQITKRLNLYADPKSLPHVQVALRMAEKGRCLVKPGDVISYLICEDGTSRPATQRAYSLLELKEEGDNGEKQLKIDKLYYLAHQVQPVICRLIEPIQGLDVGMVADCLGLPSTLAIRSSKNDAFVERLDDDEVDLTSARFDVCVPFTIVCLQCSRICEWRAPFRLEQSASFVSILERGCVDCSWSPITSLSYIKNAIVDQLCQQMHVFYLGWQRCEDVSCGHRTRQVPIRTINCRPVCPACQKSNLYPDTPSLETYTQFLFFESIFDVEQFKRAQGNNKLAELVKAADKQRHAFLELKNFVRKKFIDRSAFGYVDLSDLFEGL